MICHRGKVCMKFKYGELLKEESQGASEHSIDDLPAEELVGFPSLTNTERAPYHWPIYSPFQYKSSQPEFIDFDMAKHVTGFFAHKEAPIHMPPNSPEMPPLFYKLHPTVQSLFKNKEDLINPIQKLLECAGLQDKRNVSQADLLVALVKLNIRVSSADIARLNIISLSSQLSEQEPDSQSNLVI